MAWPIVAFSFLVGFVGQWLFSVIFVFYFSLAAATAIAILDLYFARGLASAGLAWLATIFAVQVGFVVSLGCAAIYRVLTTPARDHAVAKSDSPVTTSTAARKSDASRGN